MVEKVMRAALLLLCVTFVQCGGGDDGADPVATPAPTPDSGLGDSVRILLLHHSTGQNVWDGGVAGWIGAYNGSHAKAYQIEERAYPDDPWPWDNYPSDYYRIWVQHQGEGTRAGTEWLETLAPRYDVILFKHCFPGSDIWPDSGGPDPASGDKTLENYRAAYNALKTKLRSFPATRFIVWTLAMRTESDMQASYGGDHAGMAQRAREFTDWTKNVWDERGDNIYVWDFYALETEGSLYLRPSYAADPGGDSHPNGPFCAAVAPLLGQRIVDVIEGRGDSGSLTGR